jgi:hypothetical protein
MLKNIFIHFLDHELIELFELENHPRKTYIFQEFRFAVRLALLLCENSIVIPASNYFESLFAQQLLGEVKEFGELGYINFVSSSLNISEFIYKKQSQYSADKDRYPIYFNPSSSNLLSSIQIKWLLRTKSSTSDIKSYWIDNIGNSAVWSKIYKLSNANSTEQFESELLKVPERLEKSAFIADFVTPLLPFKEKSIYLKNRINVIITTAYIKSYLEEYDAICVSDFTSFDTSIILPQNINFVPVSKIKRLLYQTGMFDFINNASAAELLNLKISQDWRNFTDLSIKPLIYPDRLEKIDFDNMQDGVVIANGQKLTLRPSSADNLIAVGRIKSSLSESEAKQMADIPSIINDVMDKKQSLKESRGKFGDITIEGNVEHLIIQQLKGENAMPKEKRKSEVKSSWANGSFYLFAFAVVIGGLGFLSGYVPFYTLALIIIAGILIVPIIGTFQLRQDKQLSEKNLLELVKLVFQQLPLIGRLATKQKQIDK